MLLSSKFNRCALIVLVVLAGIGIYFILSSHSVEQITQRQFCGSNCSNLFPKGYTIGVWEWRSPTKMDFTQVNQELTKLNQEGFTTIYLSLNEFIDISETKDTEERNSELIALNERLSEYIRLAHGHSLVVHAVFGGSKWGNRSHRYLNEEAINQVMSYNVSAPVDARLSGIQFDIEPYTQEDYNQNKVVILGEYLDSIKKFVNAYMGDINGNKLELGFVLPFWLDKQSESSPLVSWQQKKQPVSMHVFDILGGAKDSYVVILDYRNNPNGVDGSITNARAELEYIKSSKNEFPRILIGQETGKVKPEKITFYGKGQESLKKAASEIAGELDGYDVFKGLVVNDVEQYFELKN